MPNQVIVERRRAGETAAIPVQRLLKQRRNKSQTDLAALKEKYRGTTPMGREIIRREVYRIQKALYAAGKLPDPGRAIGPK